MNFSCFVNTLPLPMCVNGMWNNIAGSRNELWIKCPLIQWLTAEHIKSK